MPSSDLLDKKFAIGTPMERTSVGIRKKHKILNSLSLYKDSSANLNSICKENEKNWKHGIQKNSLLDRTNPHSVV